MAQQLTSSSLALAGVLLALGWHFSAKSPDGTNASNPASFSHEHTPDGQTYSAPNATTSLFARASGAAQSPFATLHSVVSSEDARKQFEQLLRDYRCADLAPEEKIRIRQTLFDLKQDSLARSFIVETFFSSENPQLAEFLYGLVRDADLKDVGLLEALIQRDSNGPTTATRTRIVDLIADLSVQKDVPYSAVIDGYLAQVVLNSDTTLRNTAASQRIWYLAHHHPDNLAALDQYIVDIAPTVREEVYSVIESRLANPARSRQAELALAQKAALHADHLGVSAEEKARVTVLLETLTGSGHGT